MKLVIDIDDKTYKMIKNSTFFIESDNAFVAIRDGKPLPKGHGDLITKEQAIEIIEFYQINPQHFDFVNLIDEIKDEYPVIEADKEKQK